MTEDPFPRERVAAMIRRMPAYLRLAWRLAKDPLLSKARRAAVVGAAGYLASPVDLVPGIIPVIGQLDDIAVALAALRIALAGLDTDRRRAHLEAVGLADEDLGADLRTVGATTAWLGRSGFRTTWHVASAGGRAAVGAARMTGSAVAHAAPVARATADRLVPVARAARPIAHAAMTGAGVAGSKAASAGATAAEAGSRAAGAAGSVLRGLPLRGRQLRRSASPGVTVSPVDVPLLPPPPPKPAGD